MNTVSALSDLAHNLCVPVYKQNTIILPVRGKLFNISAENKKYIHN